MKRKIIFLIILVVLIIILFPIKYRLKDGGTTIYKSLVYKITFLHELTIVENKFNEGTIVELFNHEIYNNVNRVEIYTKDDIIDENGLLFTVEFSQDCVPVRLDIYENKYILNTSYKSCEKNNPCTLKLKYIDQIEGIYDYDVMQIINHSTVADNLDMYIDADYKIYTGNTSKIFYLVTYKDNDYF